ncbi:CAP domain-containing protein [Streptomyces minutiscleroticus]|uniref:SCP domain-containing protein n=1 Tax=Streptomyces minutiscleroticus TaxID=68238 RepID=A0A918U2I7_9ACTN|nr:CAP domain-containing protein [Streptomyces minutiscleroticus]GGX84373.1 hypothetical protein GCM10010358_43210 [Streptomyces minutiscleroticus]
MSVPRSLAALLVATAASTALTAAPASASAAPSTMRAAVIKLTNAERAKAGCSALKRNAALGDAAQRHSADMAKHHFVGHDGSSGSTMTSRAETAGYTGWRALAENVAGGQRTAAAVVKAWMKSPDHRANVVNCSLKHIGVGYVKKDGRAYWTQDFGSKS